MRNEFCQSIIEIANHYPIVFFTGDLGFMALEPLQKKLQDRFINAGVSEQNMISAAAGLASTGLQAWVYSIAPFCYARPFEQIRNDVCLNKFPVKLVGNGGGYAYGSMGGSHHALEDYGILLALQNMHIFVPAFNADLHPIIQKMAALPSPAYLRLGRCEAPKDFPLPPYAPWRRLLKGDGPLLVGFGPLVGDLLGAYQKQDEKTRPEIWVVTELPLHFNSIPPAFLKRLEATHKLCVVEEHVAQGGFGQNLLWLLHQHRIAVPEFVHAYAKGYLSGNYGSQTFHRKECGLDFSSIHQLLNS